MLENATESALQMNACSSQALKNVQMNFENIQLIYWSNLITCVLNGVTCVTAVFGNVFVLMAILSSSMMKQPCTDSAMFSGNGRFSCWLAGSTFLCHLQSRRDLRSMGYCLLHCKLVHVCVGFATTGVSLMSLMVIAVERLLAVLLHLRYNELVTTKRVKLAIGALWVISVTNTGLKFVEKDIFQAIVLIMELLSLIIATIAYHRVYNIVQKHRKEIQKHAPTCCNELDVEKYRKSAMTMFVVFMFSLLCYLPFSVYITLEAVYGFTPTVKALANIATTIICIVSSCNPCIYCFRIQEVRKAVMKLLRVKISGSVSISTGN